MISEIKWKSILFQYWKSNPCQTEWIPGWFNTGLKSTFSFGWKSVPLECFNRFRDPPFSRFFCKHWSCTCTARRLFVFDYRPWRGFFAFNLPEHSPWIIQCFWEWESKQSACHGQQPLPNQPHSRQNRTRELEKTDTYSLSLDTKKSFDAVSKASVWYHQFNERERKVLQVTVTESQQTSMC